MNWVVNHASMGESRSAERGELLLPILSVWKLVLANGTPIASRVARKESLSCKWGKKLPYLYHQSGKKESQRMLLGEWVLKEFVKDKNGLKRLSFGSLIHIPFFTARHLIEASGSAGTSH